MMNHEAVMIFITSALITCYVGYKRDNSGKLSCVIITMIQCASRFSCKFPDRCLNVREWAEVVERYMSRESSVCVN